MVNMNSMTEEMKKELAFTEEDIAQTSINPGLLLNVRKTDGDVSEAFI